MKPVYISVGILERILKLRERDLLLRQPLRGQRLNRLPTVLVGLIERIIGHKLQVRCNPSFPDVWFIPDQRSKDGESSKGLGRVSSAFTRDIERINQLLRHALLFAVGADHAIDGIGRAACGFVVMANLKLA